MKKYDNITYDVIDNEEELKIITKAYKYAYEKHFGQKRRTGEDYIIHPLNVALILTEIYADYECLCAALLHDVLEDCGVPKEEMVKEGFAGVCCVEAGGPSPGLGCAGRGIIAALEILEKKGAYEKYRPDVVIYDVLGDVVCGGFSMPMRRGYADKVFVITSGENMAIHAAANIAMAVENFKDRGYAQLGGLILNRRNVKNEDAKVEELAEDIHSKVIGTLSRSELVTDAEEQKKTVIEAYPDSEMAEEYRILAGKIRTLCGI